MGRTRILLGELISWNASSELPRFSTFRFHTLRMRHARSSKSCSRCGTKPMTARPGHHRGFRFSTADASSVQKMLSLLSHLHQVHAGKVLDVSVAEEELTKRIFEILERVAAKCDESHQRKLSETDEQKYVDASYNNQCRYGNLPEPKNCETEPASADAKAISLTPILLSRASCYNLGTENQERRDLAAARLMSAAPLFELHWRCDAWKVAGRESL